VRQAMEQLALLTLLRRHIGSAMAVTCLAWSASVEWILDPESGPVASLQGMHTPFSMCALLTRREIPSPQAT
jgi:hypothetical protein